MLYLLSYKYKFITVLVLVTFRNIGLFRMSVIIFFIRSIQSNKKCKYENSNYIRYFQYLIFIGLLVLKSINCVYSILTFSTSDKNDHPKELMNEFYEF